MRVYDEPLADEDATPIACGACSGHFQTDRSTGPASYALVACRWCIRGCQSPSQREKWERHRRRWRDSGVRRRKSDPGTITGPALAEDTSRFR